jgi:hypothetical protein
MTTAILNTDGGDDSMLFHMRVDDVTFTVTYWDYDEIYTNATYEDVAFAFNMAIERNDIELSAESLDLAINLVLDFLTTGEFLNES